MPLTQLDERAALIVIDLQKGIVTVPTVHSTAEIVERAALLAKAFRARGLPVVLVNVTGPPPGRTDTARPARSLPPDWTELIPELDAQPGDVRVSKQRIGAFIGTNLQEELQKRNVTQIFFAGISTSVGVESTARSASDYGYNVVFVADAMTDRDPEMHRLSLEKVFPRIGEVDTTENILRRLRG
jgi:nicotinamidase-related amidase